MVLPFKANAHNADAAPGEPPRILTEEEQILVSIDQGVHEVNDDTAADDVVGISLSVCSLALICRRRFLCEAFLRASMRDRFH